MSVRAVFLQRVEFLPVFVGARSYHQALHLRHGVLVCGNETVVFD